MALFRSIIFLILACILTIPVGLVLGAFCLILPLSWRFKIVSVWRAAFMGLVTHILGITMTVKGRENIPDQPCIVYCKHQSAWETVALQTIFWPCVFVMKRELYWIPFFGWGLWAIKSIAIDRKSGKTALYQIVDQGRRRYQQSLWIIIFPEGTRVAVGQQGEFGVGGAMLATKAKIPLLPVAHNAGLFWGKNALTKHRGEVMVSIGPVISPEGHTVRSINSAAAAWMRKEMAELTPPDLSERLHY